MVDGAFGDINAANISARLTINAMETVGAVASAQLIFDTVGAGFSQLFPDTAGNAAGAAVLIAIVTPTTRTLVELIAAKFLFV